MDVVLGSLLCMSLPEQGVGPSDLQRSLPASAVSLYDYTAHKNHAALSLLCPSQTCQASYIFNSSYNSNHFSRTEITPAEFAPWPFL